MDQGIKETFTKVKNRDFSGYTGLAIKNSIYQISTTVVSKVGSLVFTIILARLLMRELFGLYSLALATIVIFTTLSDLGLLQASVRFISKSLGDNKKAKAKAYFMYLGRIKLTLSILFGVMLLILSRFIAESYYNKPIFLALLAGSVYIIVLGVINFTESLFNSSNKFKQPFLKEVVLQISRIIIVPLVTLVAIRAAASSQTIVLLIILSIILCYSIAILLYYFFSKKLSFLKVKQSTLSENEKKEAKSYVYSLSLLSVSGILFGYIDILMLGKFVSAGVIGDYSVATNLIGSLYSLLAFSAVLLPIFSRIKKERLERAFGKTQKIILSLSIVLLLLMIALAPNIIHLIYGQSYSNSIALFRIFTALILLMPLTSIYESFFISQGKIKSIAKLLLGSTIINIALNYFLITYLLSYSELAATIGAAVSVVLSRAIYLIGLVLTKRKN